jgi:hypothetical protein
VPLAPDHLRCHEGVGAGAGAEVEHPFARCERAERERIGDAGERLRRAVGYALEQVGRVAEVERPGATRWENEVRLRLGRNVGVGLLDLALENLDVDADFDRHAFWTRAHPEVAFL